MESMPVSEGPKSNRNMIIAVVAAVVLCCCCLVAAVGGYYGYQAYVAGQQAVQQLQDIQIPTGIPSDPNDPNSPNIQIPDISGQNVPKGGLSDDTTRNTAWLSLQIVASISGCATPTADGTNITVVQQPDANGEWKEEWNVNCGDGTSKIFPVTFTPENGVVNVHIDLP